MSPLPPLCVTIAFLICSMQFHPDSLKFELIPVANNVSLDSVQYWQPTARIQQ